MKSAQLLIVLIFLSVSLFNVPLASGSEEAGGIACELSTRNEAEHRFTVMCPPNEIYSTLRVLFTFQGDWPHLDRILVKLRAQKGEYELDWGEKRTIQVKRPVLILLRQKTSE